jgi:rSAM/selenodomain-associated transferase 2
VSIIIPALNEEASVGDCIRSAWEAGGDEVLVADGGSRDGTVQIASHLDCRLVSCAPGRARQQNEAARQATGDVFLFLHADNRLAEGACQQIRERRFRAGTACGAFRQRIEAPGITFRLLEWGNAARVRCLGLPYGDQAIFVDRDAFRGAGGFPDVPLLEDLLLMKSLRSAHWPQLLAGPLYVSPRRWRRQGVVRQTLRNWLLLGAYAWGVPPERLARYYARHDDE